MVVVVVVLVVWYAPYGAPATVPVNLLPFPGANILGIRALLGYHLLIH